MQQNSPELARRQQESFCKSGQPQQKKIPVVSGREIIDLTEAVKAMLRKELGSLEIEGVEPDAEAALFPREVYDHIQQT